MEKERMNNLIDLKFKLLEFMKPFVKYEKEELSEYLGTDERTTRRVLTLIKEQYPIISLSCSKGYMLLGDYKTLDQAKTENILDMVRHQIDEYESRKMHFNKAERSLIAYLISAESNQKN